MLLRFILIKVINTYYISIILKTIARNLLIFGINIIIIFNTIRWRGFAFL